MEDSAIDQTMATTEKQYVENAVLSRIPFSGGQFREVRGSDTYIRWKEWLRDVEFNMKVNKISEEEKKNYVLAMGGPYLQELNETLPVNKKPDENDYEELTRRIEEHMKPKLNKIIERMKFEKIEKHPEDSMENFVFKLRCQAKYCEFVDTDDEIRTQIVKKCEPHLRRKILEKDMKLDEILSTAKALEMNEAYTENDKKVYRVKKEMGEHKKEITCYNCGRQGHTARDSQCPARGRRCNKCGKMNHFAATCRSGKMKNIMSDKKRVRELSSREVRKDDDDNPKYIFALNDKEMDVWVEMGGTKAQFIIDSGADVNCIDENTWAKLKRDKIRIEKQHAGADVPIFAYGSSKQIEVLGSFETDLIDAVGKKIHGKFYVVKGHVKNILGRKTAMELRMLMLGQNLFNVEEKLPAIKGDKMLN